ncbi:MAG TPA: AtpZ/AtpI family protein [bacterium]|nr:AtpZ/AtpI family protein [bacterium]
MIPFVPRVRHQARGSAGTDSESGRQQIVRAVNGSTLGLTFAFSVLVGFAIGYGLDRLFHTSPLLMIVFILLGLASGILNIVRAIKDTSSQ